MFAEASAPCQRSALCSVAPLALCSVAPLVSMCSVVPLGRDDDDEHEWSALFKLQRAMSGVSCLNYKDGLSENGYGPGLYYLLGVYFMWSVLTTPCLLSVSTLRASTFRRD